MEEIIVHQYKIRFKGDYYRALVTGSKYEAEKYFKNELKANEIIWEKSFVTTKDIAIRIGTGNKTIARQGFFLRMEFLCQMGTKRTAPLVTKPRTFKEIQSIIKKDSSSKFSLKEIIKAQKIKPKELAGELFISSGYLNKVIRGSEVPSDDLKELICDYLDISADNIEWTGKEDGY